MTTLLLISVNIMNMLLFSKFSFLFCCIAHMSGSEWAMMRLPAFDFLQSLNVFAGISLVTYICC